MHYKKTLSSEFLENIQHLGTRGFFTTGLGWALERVYKSATTLNDNFCLQVPSQRRWNQAYIEAFRMIHKLCRYYTPIHNASKISLFSSGFINKIRSRFILYHSFDSETVMATPADNDRIYMAKDEHPGCGADVITHPFLLKWRKTITVMMNEVTWGTKPNHHLFDALMQNTWKLLSLQAYRCTSCVNTTHHSKMLAIVRARISIGITHLPILALSTKSDQGSF